MNDELDPWFKLFLLLSAIYFLEHIVVALVRFQ
jgi:hypothetical protein